MSPSDQFTLNSADYIVNTPKCVQKFLKELSNSKSKEQFYKPSYSMQLILRLLTSIKIGTLDVIMPNNQRLRFNGSNDGPHQLIQIHNDRVARRFFLKGHLGFCEAYLDGDWSSPDIAGFFRLMLFNVNAFQDVFEGRRWARTLSNFAHWLKPNTRKGSRKNIYSHYDLGNDFYASWLDKSMTYSSALFKDGNENLKVAQDAKYQEMINRLELKSEHHLLEIGCGWGGFAEYAARQVGCKITAVTVSPSQYEFAKNRIKDAGLHDLVEIRLQDYRDIDGQFDRIASIEMYEAVGEAYWSIFFETLKSKLNDNGKAVLQIITMNEKDFPIYRKSADFIQLYIFPGGMLPSMSALKKQITKAGLKQGEHISFGKDYAKTLKIWNEEFQQAWQGLKSPKMDNKFKRLWELYFSYCEAGFDMDKIDVIQIDISK